MHCFRAFTILFCIVCLPGPVVPGQGRVVEIAKPGKGLEKDRQPAAHRRGAVEERQDALQEATDLARHSPGTVGFLAASSRVGSA